jgi:hypothetical protein
MVELYLHSNTSPHGAAVDKLKDNFTLLAGAERYIKDDGKRVAYSLRIATADNGDTRGSAMAMAIYDGQSKRSRNGGSIGPATVGILRSSAVAFHLMSMVAKRVPLRPIFRAGNSQKSLGARVAVG